MAFKELVFSGVQPTGNLHLGNYLGAIKRFVELQDRYDCIYCVVDLHAITVWQDPIELPKAIREVTAAFIACGIDPKKHIVFNQSQVAEHAELAWVFNCVARLGWLNRMTQFKEKAGKDRENASVGLYAYPTLMAADILVYRATHVPVGEDQKQHLELSRDIAQKFNNDFGQSIRDKGFGDAFFPQPEPLITGEATRVMSLRDGTKKMSKSDAFRPIAHQSHRRRRRHRAESSPRQNRPGAAAERGEGSRDPARSRQPGRHFCRARRHDPRRRAQAIRQRAVLDLQGGFDRSCRRKTQSDQFGNEAAPQRPRRDRRHTRGRLGPGTKARRRNHEGGQGYRRFRALLGSLSARVRT